jgi:hemoglobin-like flavoprotein
LERDDVICVHEVFEGLLGQGPVLAGNFFKRLGDTAPALLPADLELTRDVVAQFMTTIATVISELNNPHRVAPLLVGLTKQYCRQDVLLDDLDQVCAALTWALEQSLGTGYTARFRTAWLAGCEMLTGEILAPTQAPECVPGASRSAGTWTQTALGSPG